MGCKSKLKGLMNNTTKLRGRGCKVEVANLDETSIIHKTEGSLSVVMTSGSGSEWSTGGLDKPTRIEVMVGWRELQSSVGAYL
jgi:hypothetical protein